MVLGGLKESGLRSWPRPPTGQFLVRWESRWVNCKAPINQRMYRGRVTREERPGAQVCQLRSAAKPVSWVQETVRITWQRPVAAGAKVNLEEIPGHARSLERLRADSGHQI